MSLPMKGVGEAPAQALLRLARRGVSVQFAMLRAGTFHESQGLSAAQDQLLLTVLPYVLPVSR